MNDKHCLGLEESCTFLIILHFRMVNYLHLSISLSLLFSFPATKSLQLELGDPLLYDYI